MEESRVRKIAGRLEDVEKKTQSGKEGYGNLKLMLNKLTPRPGAVVKKTDEKTTRECSKPLDFYFTTTPVGTLRQKVGTPFWEKIGTVGKRGSSDLRKPFPKYNPEMGAEETSL